MPVDELLHAIASRYERVRSGLDVGFGDEEVSRALHESRGGVWRTIGDEAEFPFEDAQFEVVVMDGAKVTRGSVREANRVLRPDGCLFFTVPERTRRQQGLTPQEVYRLIREGFSILSVDRPAWWKFGRGGRTLTVCARKKAWREHKSLFHGGAAPYNLFRSMT